MLFFLNLGNGSLEKGHLAALQLLITSQDLFLCRWSDLVSLKEQEIFVLLQGQDAQFRQLSPVFSLSWCSADVTSKLNNENSLSKYPLGFSPITVPIFTETS